jgi:hypothetical protein
MITTIADLLNEFRHREMEMLDRQDITHGPTIGSMYEGLTREVLNMALPQQDHLRVVSGFIVNDTGKKSNQIDCMLVKGEGEQIPYTDNFKYNIRDVIAVVEVKKNLYSNDLSEAYNNLLSVKDISVIDSVNAKLVDDAYKSIVRSLPPENEAETKSLPLWKQHIFAALAVDGMSPARIVIGYHGFANEFNFRERFVKYLWSNVGKKGFSPASLPSLIICNNYSLVKVNGMPYAAAMTENMWPLYASYSNNPMILLLEIIWTRLTYGKQVGGSVFGEDISFEVLKPLILAQYVSTETRSGW